MTHDANRNGIIRLTFTAQSPLRPGLRAEPIHQISERQQPGRGERAAVSRNHHERVRRHHVGPCCWQREQLPILIVQVDPVLTPVLAVGDELEVPAGQGMERVRHTDTSVSIVRIRCS